MSTTHDLVVIGGGAAGLTAAGVAVNLGASVALVERERLGGDCTWTGCVPSKTLLKAARVVHQAGHASAYGLPDTPIAIDFAALMAHVRGVREHVYEDADAPPVFEAMGVDIRHGAARFLSEREIEVVRGDGVVERLCGRTVIIATGARPAVPDIEGLAETPYLTSETLFEITEQPRHLAILGGGPIGTEMAQAFRRLGSDVTVIERGDRILSKDEPEPAEMLRGVLEAEGVRFRLGSELVHAARDGDGVALTLRENGVEALLGADALLVAVGRSPNVESLGVDAAGLHTTRRGITVDDRCRTNVDGVFAAGDVTGRYALTHMSEHMAKTAAMNAVLKLPSSIDTAHVPWATYADPELAHVGATAAELDERGTHYETFRFPYERLDRAVTDGETTGLLLVHATRLGAILGASVLGARGGDVICELALAMRNGVSLREISDTIHPYPTYGLGARRVADQWYARLQKGWVVRGVRTLLRLHGPVNAYEPGQIV